MNFKKISEMDHNPQKFICPSFIPSDNITIVQKEAVVTDHSWLVGIWHSYLDVDCFYIATFLQLFIHFSMKRFIFINSTMTRWYRVVTINPEYFQPHQDIPGVDKAGKKWAVFCLKHLRRLSFNVTAFCLDDSLNSGAKNTTAVDDMRGRYLGSLMLDGGL